MPETGEYRSVRAFTSGYLAVNGLLVVISVGLALVAMAFLFAATRGAQLAAIGSWLTVLSWCAWIAALGTVVAAWLWTNRRRSFVWCSEEGIGYLPSRVGDRGYLIWSDVASIEYSELMEARAFWTTGHEFAIVTKSGEKSVVRMMSGLSVPCADIASLLNDTAPHVRRVGIDPDDSPWGDVVPQRGRQ